MVDNSKVLNLSKTLRVNHNDLRVCCSSGKIRLLHGAQNYPSIHVAQVLYFLEVGRHVVL